MLTLNTKAQVQTPNSRLAMAAAALRAAWAWLSGAAGKRAGPQRATVSGSAPFARAAAAVEATLGVGPAASAAATAAAADRGGRSGWGGGGAAAAAAAAAAVAAAAAWAWAWAADCSEVPAARAGDDT